jgi:hypothetical protein
MDNFDSYLENTIFPLLRPIDEKRRKGITAFWITFAVIFAVAVIIIASAFSIFTLFFVGIFSLIIIGIIKGAIFKGYNDDFSSAAIQNIVKYIDKNLEFSRGSRVTEEEYKTSRLYLTSYDGFTGQDLVYGQLGKTAVRFSYLYTYYETEDEDSDGHKTTHRYTIFSGLFFKADFNKNFLGEVYVLPHSFRFFSPRKGAARVRLEDPDFNDTFDVFGTDSVITMYVLSTSLVKRLMDFKHRVNSNIRLSMIDSTLYVAIDNYKPLKIPVFGDIYDKSLYYGYLSQLKFAAGIVDDLNLNTRIWGR